MSQNNFIQLVSFTGADNVTNIEDMVAIANSAYFRSLHRIKVEYGILYFPEKQGRGRNPSFEWQNNLFKYIGPNSQKGQTRRSNFSVAAHLCGRQVFDEILAENSDTLNKLVQFDRLQININARAITHTDTQVLLVYKTLLTAGFSLVLQYNDQSAQLIEQFLEQDPFARLCLKNGLISLLLDSSKGKGIVPEQWDMPPFIKKIAMQSQASGCICFAGGISPVNIESVISSVNKCIEQAISSGSKCFYGIDMESGVRNEADLFDLDKVSQVLNAVLS